jgi:hypothetical protein
MFQMSDPFCPQLGDSHFGFDHRRHAGLGPASATASPSCESKIKALVLEAFETPFNKRDYEAAERFWSPNYIQHSTQIEYSCDTRSPSAKLARVGRSDEWRVLLLEALGWN